MSAPHCGGLRTHPDRRGATSAAGCPGCADCLPRLPEPPSRLTRATALRWLLPCPGSRADRATPFILAAIIAAVSTVFLLTGCGGVESSNLQAARQRSAQTQHAADVARRRFRCTTYGEDC